MSEDRCPGDARQLCFSFVTSGDHVKGVASHDLLCFSCGKVDLDPTLVRRLSQVAQHLAALDDWKKGGTTPK